MTVGPLPLAQTEMGSKGTQPDSVSFFWRLPVISSLRNFNVAWLHSQLQHCLGRMTVIQKSSGKHDTVSSFAEKIFTPRLAGCKLFLGVALQNSLGVRWWFGLAQKYRKNTQRTHSLHSRSCCNLPGLLIKQIYLASMLNEEPDCLIQPASFAAFQT